MTEQRLLTIKIALVKVSLPNPERLKFKILNLAAWLQNINNFKFKRSIVYR